MKSITLAALGATGTLAALAAPVTAYAAPVHAPKCVTVHDHITKTDTGHGTPAEWADLSLNRTTTVCGSNVKLVDVGTLWTRPGAGTPNGAGGTIAHRVHGTVHGTYALTVTGGTLAHRHGDTSLSSTAYVKSLFSDSATVTGGTYTWTYTTRCGERWVDSSTNNDGQGAAAGNITGRACPRATPSPTARPSTTPTAPSSGRDGPTTVPVGAPQTGDGTTAGGGHNPWLISAGILLLALVGVSWILARMRRRGHHH